MCIFKHRDRSYQVDLTDFLKESQEWDENFAEGMAPKANIPNGLTPAHWEVISFIRNHFQTNGVCPMVYQTCRANHLNLKGLKSLFPTGYQRGACKLAGMTYREGFLGYSELPDSATEVIPFDHQKTYTVDMRGFLVNVSDWDKAFAIFKAHELKMPGKIGPKHWQVIGFLRDYWDENQKVPTVYDACEALQLEIDDLESLFPDGYHRGAVKIAGLRLR
jgi:tRNA 2-thiouridine synthesizing protein E